MPRRKTHKPGINRKKIKRFRFKPNSGNWSIVASNKVLMERLNALKDQIKKDTGCSDKEAFNQALRRLQSGGF